MHKAFTYIATSTLAGVAAAYIAVSLFTTPTQELSPTTRSISSQIHQEGPVSYASAVQLAAPAVVNIFTAKVTVQRSNSLFNDPLFQRFFGDRFQSQPRKKLQTSLGSGVIVSNKGYILTNHHVIADADEIRIVLSNGRTLDATIAGVDPDTDLAVLKTDTKDLPIITIGDSQAIQVGDVVLAIGNPYGVGQTVTMGIVSATGRDQLGINTFENFIQTDAAINPGNSGGALINAHGELVGINTAIFSKSGGSQGIGFAIPVTLAKGVMEQILKKGRVVRGWLGIAGQDITPELAESFGLKEHSGVLVSGVLNGGPADKAGIQPGDVIAKIDDKVLTRSHDILNIIAAVPPGEKVNIQGWRDGASFDIDVEVSERPRIQKSE
ncbi:MAG: Do family serine endopeptidase [Sedimenticola sp.]|uniref:Do family serine endopeptidase n=1 Tax=Sedimenticola thiotaurini TaxID=1543721 RepID=A0A558DG04_9GAMM|nr:Do family serine endopeptidase [Sedimenticola sp.]MCW8975890.1 Do family serine endopeptidase [Sedimenticola sp.]MCW9022342.1 Do family serine endopeptidase [Sedimenticola sp.]TVT59961.1 MAG: Do family serine endopeptidase [Sedimenticola thiotaurini]